ncbi:MAG: alpha/beta hydrolase [Actinomycetota bacterium]|nr:alpha/beta hydrolase [Actinomycetota bacterium]
MGRVQTNGVEIEYEVDGDPGDPTLLLVSGLGGQLIGWDDGFVELLIARGFRVVRFDNRDAGLSTKCTGDGAAILKALFTGTLAPSGGAIPYTIEDMADDAIGLMDALSIDAAHLVGISMGGMIAQAMAAHNPGRARSLCSLMSTTGAPGVADSQPGILEALASPPAPDAAGRLAQGIAAARLIGSQGTLFDEDRVRTKVVRELQRCDCPAGVARQLLAIVASGDRTDAVAKIAVPTVVVHGSADPLVPLGGGEATARTIGGAQLLVIDGMGHDLPVQVWERVANAVCDNAARAGAFR